MQINPHYDVAYYNLGYTYKSMNQLEKAIYWYKKCLEVNP
jgi:tetratricopeptide (TPR) repeat protein